jgi:topoisomerase-4 subunit A
VPELALHFDADMMYLEKLIPHKPLSAVYFDGEKSRYFVKRFDWEGGDKEENIVTAHPKSELVFLSNDLYPRIEMVFRKQGGELKESETVELTEFISVKGIKAKGNQLTTDTLNKISGLDPLPEPELIEEITSDIEETPLETPEAETLLESHVDESSEDVSDKDAYDADGKAPQITLDF